jgi:hypothetical protein
VQRAKAKSWAALLWLSTVAAVSLCLDGCKDISRFTTQPGESYCGTIVPAPFVRGGFRPGVRMRLSLDAEHLSDAPGKLATDDGFFADVELRPIPQLQHDPLSTLQFGEGRTRNLIFGVEPNSCDTALAVVSLMDNGDVEVRIVRGAPMSASDAGTSADDSDPLFGLFPLERQKGTCGF